MPPTDPIRHAALKARWHQEVKKPQIEALRQEVLEYKRKAGCSRCPEDHPVCLDFHHMDPAVKINAIAKLISNGTRRDLVFIEIAKCVLLCANCHRKEHALIV